MPPLLAVRNMSASGNFIVGDLGDVMHTKLVTSWGDVMGEGGLAGKTVI